MLPRVEDDLLELQALLREDASGEHLASLRLRFEELGRHTKRLLDAGVSPSDFAPLDNLLQATAAADVVVTRVWQRFHPSGGTR